MNTRLHFTKYRISTITSNVDVMIDNIKTPINLYRLFENININDTDANFVYTYCIDKSTGCKICRGELPKKKKKRNNNNEKTFDNQISFVYRVKQDYYPNVKVFKNGNIQMTGHRCIEDISGTINCLMSEMRRISKIRDDLFSIDLDNVKFDYDNFQINMINTDFTVYTNDTDNVQFMIKRKVLHDILIDSEDIIARFDPATYPGVKIEYWWDKSTTERNGSSYHDKRAYKSKTLTENGVQKITIAIFESGKVLITGGVSIEQIDEAYAWICNVLDKNSDLINKS